MFRILVVEDDVGAARLMRLVLEEACYTVKLANNGVKALKMLDSEYVDLIVLDLVMPEMNGHEFLETIRANGIDIPVIVVTARNTAEDKYKAFENGADDYLVKPIDIQEFIYRVKAILRRANFSSEQKITIGKVTLNYDSLTVCREDEKIALPKKEFFLLFKLLSYPEKIFTRLQLMDEIWGMNTTSVDTTVNVHINRLRNKFSHYPEFDIVTIKGLGYKAVIHNEE